MTADDFRSASGTYDDLVSKYRLTEIITLPFSDDVPLDDPDRQRKIVAIRYEKIK